MIETTQMSQKDRSCSLEACLNQVLKRSMFSSSWRTIVPVDGAAWSSPVIGETIFGT